MKPIYLDLHIHTSENPNCLNEAYNVDALLQRIREVSNNANYLISLTDHNVINKSAYLRLVEKTPNVLLGVELHIRNYPEKPPYHCHMFFNTTIIDDEIIDSINVKLNELYPNKIINTETENVPTIHQIINTFDKDDFLLLPHGGQSHRTFDKSIPDGVIFDTTLERSIYYNQFDGFTARSNTGLESTVKYFKRLGINEFVNLITSSDNYSPELYPKAKAEDAEPFLPTWMYASPTFNGLRISLSESSRFVYSNTIPTSWAEFIKRVTLENERISIDVELTPGLNVVIGGSSSGKTLFVDSIYKKICTDFSECNYSKFQVEDINVINPSGIKPHYINQNFIINILNSEDKGINEIEIINKVFPVDESIDEKVRRGLASLKQDLGTLIKLVKIIEKSEDDLSRIPIFTHLITNGSVKKNLFSLLLPEQGEIAKYNYGENIYNTHIQYLKEIEEFLRDNVFTDKLTDHFTIIRKELSKARNISLFESDIRNIIHKFKENMDQKLISENREQQIKAKNKEKLFQLISEYVIALKSFEETLNKISHYDITCETKTIEVMGHKLSIENVFVLSKEKVLEVINKYLKRGYQIESFDTITPHNLFESKYKKQMPKVDDYDDFERRVYTDFEKINKRNYRIISKDGVNFDKMSPGWKTSVLLDIILGYDQDLAPLIIDQPEDNLATNYINDGLIKSIKSIKTKKQVILVSHNATIPMLGDAQNIILCKNEGEKIIIRSDYLEGNIGDKSMVDYIAEITDGGKSSIKKRVKKYNLKSFRGDENET